MVNLVVDLRDECFNANAHERAQRTIESAGYTVERSPGGSDETLLAWIDDVFGGTWSSEAFAGESVVARKGDRYAGFATYDPRGLCFRWLRGLGAEKGVGVFGPFGVALEDRKSGIGPHLLVAALCSLRKKGYARALIPAVGEEKLVTYYERFAGACVAESFEKAALRSGRYRTVVMASGNGSNFQAVIDRAGSGRLPLEVTALLCNVPNAYVLERARGDGIASISSVVWNRAEENRDAYDARLRVAVEREMPDLVLLLGWMHVLDEAFVRAFPQVINVHPAFLPLDQSRASVTMPDGFVLPAFRGARALRDALRSGARWTGATAHRVSLDVDRGTVLVRKPLPVALGESEVDVAPRLHALEHDVVASGIMRWVFERPD